MTRERFRCRCCGELVPRRSAEQRYCGKPACQQARKRAWRRAKYAADPDYRMNQAQSTAAWLGKQGGAASYYREYRRRQQGPGADTAARCEPVPASANRDAKSCDSPIIPGRYRLLPLDGANRDAVSVYLAVIVGNSDGPQISTPSTASSASGMPRGHVEQELPTEHSHCR
jgi:hypothetical protein